MEKNENEIKKKNIEELEQRINSYFTRYLVKAGSNFDLPAFLRSFYDYYIHLAYSPGTQYKLTVEYQDFLAQLAKALSNPDIDKKDKRFSYKSWNIFPFNALRDSFLAYEDYLKRIFNAVSGVNKHNEYMINFMVNQFAEILNPLNNPFTNPEVIETTIKEKGENLVRGMNNLINNLIENQGEIRIRHVEKNAFTLGKDLAFTEGKVIFKNEIIELIQYKSKTKQQYKIPVLIVPAWINKYYILDLDSEKSIVQYLLENGHQVFMISWKSATTKISNYGFEEYIKLGIVEAMNAVKEVTGQKQINMVGYCMGSILLALAAAYLGGNKDNSINSFTFFAGQIDFSDAGELTTFIDESQLNFVKDLMGEKGHLNKEDMAKTFSMLRSRDLFYSYAIKEFLLGESPYPFDMLYWNDDSTRIPGKLHIEMLKKLYFEDQITEVKFKIDGKNLDPRNINADMYSVATIKDHIAPWISVYRIPHFVNSKVKFILSSSGHIAGIINPPSKKSRRYYFKEGEHGQGPEHWKNTAKRVEGSWWPDWLEWLKTRAGEKVEAYKYKQSGKYKPIYDSPGKYVLEQ